MNAIKNIIFALKGFIFITNTSLLLLAAWVGFSEMFGRQMHLGAAAIGIVILIYLVIFGKGE